MVVSRPFAVVAVLFMRWDLGVQSHAFRSRRPQCARIHDAGREGQQPDHQRHTSRAAQSSMG